MSPTETNQPRPQPGESGCSEIGSHEDDGHKMEVIHRRYAIAEEKMLGEAGDKLEIFQAADQQESDSKVVAK
jgi:hypothetical protein